ncbi:MAG: transposase [Pyramidobacter sp.]|uniref:transposase n=1 Tax=Pyramidobacter sp. TaxID=1943581 RepID=UPI0025D5B892|nr:transposase [Pyramidobacter sp.]MCI7403735.1 transposase [Pyramidobacter sp.]
MIGLFEVIPDKKRRCWLYALAAVIVVVMLAAWYWHGYAGRRETDIVISRLRESAATSERRADAIVDATRQREVTVRETVRKKTAELPADRLVAALERMLAEYRARR